MLAYYYTETTFFIIAMDIVYKYGYMCYGYIAIPIDPFSSQLTDKNVTMK